MPFVAVQSSAHGPSLPIQDVRFSAACEGKADVSAIFAKRRFDPNLTTGDRAWRNNLRSPLNAMTHSTASAL
jgi:hypothetical protein